MDSTISAGGPTEGFTPIEAERAIYIDFEGTETDPPSFLGAAWADDAGGLRFVQYVLEPALWPAAEATAGVCGGVLVTADWRDLAELRRIAEAEDRRIIAWSDRERDARGPPPRRGRPAVVRRQRARREAAGEAVEEKVRPEMAFERDRQNRMEAGIGSTVTSGSSATRCRRSSVPATQPNGSAPCAANSRGAATTRR